jgi:hypothetical protein
MKDSKKQQLSYLKQLMNLGYLEYAKKVNNKSVRVTYIDNEIKAEDIVINLEDFRDCVLAYLKWKGENIINCEGCNRLIYSTATNKKYCKDCAKEMQLQWQRESWQKNKDKYRPAKVATNPEKP